MFSHPFNSAQFVLHVANKGSHLPRGFRKDPVVYFFNEVLRRLTLIRAAALPPVQVNHSSIEGMDAFGLFSQDHFENMLCHVFNVARKSWSQGPGDYPIIWQLKASDRNVHLGKARLLIITPGGRYPVLAAAAQVFDDNELFRRTTAQGHGWCHPDIFLATVQTASPFCPVGHVMVGRLYLDLVCKALNAGHGVKTVKLGQILNAASNHCVGGSFMLSYFWASETAMKNFVTTCGKKWAMFQCKGFDDVNCLERRHNRNVWTAVLRGINPLTLRRRIRDTTGNAISMPAPADLLEYTFVFNENHALSNQLNGNLDSFTLGHAIRSQNNEMVLTQILLEQLVVFRTGWVGRRNALQTHVENGRSAAVKLDMENEWTSFARASNFVMNSISIN